MRLAIPALVLSLFGTAHADDTAEPARCKLRVVHALPQAGGVDEKLAVLKGRLQRAPFGDWKTFRLLSEEERELKPGATAEYALPGGRKALVTFAKHSAADGGKHRVHGALRLEGGKSASKTDFTLDEGGLFLVAGSKHEGGILIYALGCKTEK